MNVRGNVGRGEKMDSRLRRSALRAALRASVVALLLGANRIHSAPKYSVGIVYRLGGPLPPEGMMNKDDRLAARQKIYAKLLCFDFLQRLTH